MKLYKIIINNYPVKVKDNDAIYDSIEKAYESIGSFLKARNLIVVKQSDGFNLVAVKKNNSLMKYKISIESCFDDSMNPSYEDWDIIY